MREKDLYQMGQFVERIVREAVDLGSNGLNRNRDGFDVKGPLSDLGRGYKGDEPKPEYQSSDNHEAKPDGFGEKKGYASFYQQKSSYPRPSMTAGVLFTVLGSIGTALFGCLTLLFLIGLAIGVPEASAITAVFAIFTGCFGGGMGYGIKRIRQAGRMKKYLRYFTGKHFCSIEELTHVVGQKQSVVLKDYQAMKKQGLLPQARLDKKKVTIMLDQETYKQYLDAEIQYKERIENPASSDNVYSRQGRTGNSELDNVINEGREYINRIRDVNLMIQGRELFDKISQLEQVTVQLFGYVEEKPEQLNNIRKFMNYYLPTTLKLLDAYSKFDSQVVQGESIKKAKAEIAETLDTINGAFKNLLNELQANDVMEISSEISVLEKMLKQEGLTDGDFKNIH